MTDVVRTDNNLAKGPPLTAIGALLLAAQACHLWAPGVLVGHALVLKISASQSIPDRGFWAKLECFNPGGSMKEGVCCTIR